VQELAIGPYAVGLAGFLCTFRMAGLQAKAPAGTAFFDLAYRPRGFDVRQQTPERPDARAWSR
jgi:hypothetical protein